MTKGFGQLLNQAKKMQENFQKLQQEMEGKTIEAQSGGGMVTCVVNGKQEVVSLTISNDVWEEHDKEMLEDLIVAAINEGLEKSKEMWKEELAKITGGVQLPFGM
ncbi:MAG TPA: YbaB/EbfC family nucleoid-associated protein [Syntrophorhabdales bacterium]|nr:YbaB/EbfC family nucleoid-associated protein [Syntrophorhabdales bacterium]